MHSKFPLQEFNETKRLNPYWSDYICFAEIVIRRKNLHARTIKRYFEQLVDKEDYAKPDKRQILNFLISSSRGVA